MIHNDKAIVMKEKQTGLYHSGTSGLVLPVPNKQAFPPAYKDKSRLAYYASLFNSIEINRSFYTVPMANTVKRWTEEVPAGFTFTYKLWRGITHVKDLAYRDEDVTRFMSVIEGAGSKKAACSCNYRPRHPYSSWRKRPACCLSSALKTFPANGK